MPRKVCNEPMCGKVATDGGAYCEDHTYAWNKRGRKNNRQTSKLYNHRWRKYRASYLKRHPLCVKCGKFATDLDHIVPHRGDPKKFWDLDNLQPLCRSCHSSKTATEDNGAWDSENINI